jgi:hypothetical protein
MTNVNFLECISALQLTLLRNERNELSNYGNDFWYIIDHLENDKLITWCERLLKIKGLIQGNSYIMMTNMINDHVRLGIELSTKQKRWLAMSLLRNWDNISFHYEY